jgi:protein-disulfide isomerase
MKNKMFVFGVVLLALGLFAAMKLYAPAVAPVASVAPLDSAASLIRPHSVSYGNTMARVSVVEWFDPACEACREIYPAFKRLISKYSDRVHFVLRYMPYHEGSLFAAAVLEEAREIGKFDEALHVLFEKQPEWASHHAPRPELIPNYLSKLGLAADQLDSDEMVKKHGEKIKLDESDGNRLGVRGTPSFFINGQRVLRFDENNLTGAIEGAIEESQN